MPSTNPLYETIVEGTAQKAYTLTHNLNIPIERLYIQVQAVVKIAPSPEYLVGDKVLLSASNG